MAILDTFFDGVIEEDSSVKPPIAVLKELAQGLETKTKGLLLCKVDQTVWTDKFELEFYITAPSLNDYSYKVFSLKHDLNFYPLDVYEPRGGGMLSSSSSFSTAKDQKELEEILKTIFSSSQVKRVINGLLAQIKSTN